MDQQVGADLPVGFEVSPDLIYTRRIAHPDRGGGEQSLDVHLIGVEQEADERLSVVGFVLDVGEHEHARLDGFFYRAGRLDEVRRASARLGRTGHEEDQREQDAAPKQFVHRRCLLFRIIQKISS